jgi:hypothetical protein
MRNELSVTFFRSGHPHLVPKLRLGNPCFLEAPASRANEFAPTWDGPTKKGYTEMNSYAGGRTISLLQSNGLFDKLTLHRKSYVSSQ